MLEINIRVPATTANLGAGFNCLGMAMGLYTNLKMTETHSGMNIEIFGEGKGVFPRDERNLSFRAADKVFKECGYVLKGIRLKLNNNIPISRGLGSSAASIVAGAVAANELCSGKLTQDDLIYLCAELEGHADNVVAAFLGGMTICGFNGDQLIYKKSFVRYGIRAILAIPENLEITTKDSVSVLPKKVPFEDAVFNINRGSGNCAVIEHGSKSL